MSTLTLFILCRNRPDFTRLTLRSILAQTDMDFDLIISDNSTGDEVERMVNIEFPKVNYRRRVPPLPYLAHFNQCIEEAHGDYFCLFHDDDLMHPNFVRQMKLVLDAHPGAVACSSNAQIETMGKIETRTSFRALNRLEWITSPRDLARRYFARSQSGIAPFPAYVYRKRLVDDVRLPVDGGKYADVTLLLDLAARGPMVWLNETLMTYRVHGGNIGSGENLHDRLRFLAYIKKNLKVLGKDLLADYRCSFIYKPLANSQSTFKWRGDVARRFLAYYGWSRYTNLSLYSALIRRAFIKRRFE